MPTHAALLIVDVISDLEFPGGEKVHPWAEGMADALVPVRDAARKAGLPVIYANDNFGQWKSNFDDVYQHAARAGARGRNVARKLKPGKEDFFILKPKHSAFFATSLEPLLQSLNVRTLILAGIATNICVLFTAHDAYMREYEIIVLSDCCAAETDHDHDEALIQLVKFCGSTVCRSNELDLKTLKVKRKSPPKVEKKPSKKAS
ncbi:MAG TPA: isochorismatase family cysteine hydrolase [Tepidisphaeraceae bacterium]|jgi:nicotinamidase-related amidase